MFQLQVNLKLLKLLSSFRLQVSLEDAQCISVTGQAESSQAAHYLSATGQPESSTVKSVALGQKRKRNGNDIQFLMQISSKPRNAETRPVQRQSCLIVDQSRINAMVQIISRGAQLTDEEINHGQAILKMQHPDVEGFQDMAIFEDNGCHFLGTPTGPFVQILLAFSNHWICVSNIGCREGQVKVYDSIWRGRLNAKLQKQIAWLMFTQEPQITIEWPDIQSQRARDCGLFCLAVAAALCQGQDPATCSWDQSLMRKHLASCFRSGEVSLFPTTVQVRPVGPAKVIEVNVSCHCRQPKVDKRLLVQCQTCKGWFHRTCDNIPVGARSDQIKFICQVCRV